MSLLKAIRRVFLYLGIAIGCLVVFSVVFFISMRTGFAVPHQWVALAIFTGVLGFVIIKTGRSYWNRRGFWLIFSVAITAHLVAFIPVLRAFPEFPPFWYVPIVIGEASAFGAVRGLVLPDARKRQSKNPFKIGDRVVFSPDKRTIGWSWPSFDRVRLNPGDAGVVTHIEKGMYLYLDDGRGGFHWEQFKKAR